MTCQNFYNFNHFINLRILSLLMKSIPQKFNKKITHAMTIDVGAKGNCLMNPWPIPVNTHFKSWKSKKN